MLAVRDGILSEASAQIQSVARWFAVSVTDGVLDYLSPDAIAEEVAKSLYEGGDSGVAVKEFLTSVAQSWDEDFGDEYRDDISIALVDISDLLTSKE